MRTGPDRHFHRIVLGCYRKGDGYWAALEDLRAHGLPDDQMCLLGSCTALALPGAGKTEIDPASGRGSQLERYQHRRIRQLDVLVSSAALFDGLWSVPPDDQNCLTPWMTPSQSLIVWQRLTEDCPLLMVAADNAKQQVQNSRIHLRHGPMLVQAFDIAAQIVAH